MTKDKTLLQIANQVLQEQQKKQIGNQNIESSLFNKLLQTRNGIEIQTPNQITIITRLNPLKKYSNIIQKYDSKGIPTKNQQEARYASLYC